MDINFLNYPPDVLNRLQNVELEILNKFDQVCQKYGITYWASFGTAIGAIRHQNFIPWDDDIDVGVMLDDYDKLLQIPSEEWGNMVFVSGKDDVPYHHSLFARLYKKDTVLESHFRTTYSKSKGWPNNAPMPIWIDIFIFNHFKDLDTVKQNINKSLLYRKLYWCSKSGMRINKKDNLRKKIGCITRDIIHRLLNISSNSYKTIYNKYLNLLRELDNSGGKYISCLTCSETYEMTGLFCKEEDMFPVVRVPFANMTIPMPNNYHEILTNIYGDYMSLPPEEKRVNHCPAILDFGDGKGNVFLKQQ